MKSESQFPKLPSLGELLQHPTVEKVVERVNQSTIAQRAAGFLTELQTSLRDKADQDIVPSLGQLAERLAQRLLGHSEHSLPVINATGEICSPRWQTPLAEVAVQEMLRVAGEFHASSELQQRATAQLCDLTGAESAWVVCNYHAAQQLVGQCQGVEVETTQYAGLLNPAEYGLLPVQTLTDYVQADAELIVCDAAGLLGGPSCGVILGRRQAVEEVRCHADVESFDADAMILVALLSTLDIYRNQKRVIHQIPIWQLLSAPIENLQQRSERLAPLIADSCEVADAIPAAGESTWFETPQMRLAGPTWAVKLQPAQQSPEEFSQLLRNSLPPVAARIESDGIWLDLRSMFPRWDQRLVEVFQTT